MSFCTAQPFGQLPGSSPDFPSWNLPILTKGIASAGSSSPPLSSSMGIPANNCSYQKKKSQQALRLQDMNICTVNPAPRATLVQLGKRHLTCLPRKTTPHHFKQTLRRTCCVHLWTNYSLKLSSEYFWEMNWYWERCKFLLGYWETPSGLKRAGISFSVPAAEAGNRTAVCTQSVTSLPSLYTRKCSFLFPQRSPSHATFRFQCPFLLRKSQMFISSLLFSALDFSPGPKSTYQLKLHFGHKLSLSFFKLSGLVFKVGTPRTILDLAVRTRNPRDAVLCSDEDFHHVCIWKLRLVEQAAHFAFAVGQLPMAWVLCNEKKGKLSSAQIQQQIVQSKSKPIFLGWWWSTS